MKPTIAKPFSDARSRSRRKIIGMYVLLIAGNLASWLWALVALHNYPALLGTAFLAYALGLRHAFDADHIAAIDNVTRKLMQEAGDRRLQDCSPRWTLNSCGGAFHCDRADDSRSSKPIRFIQTPAV